MSDAMISAVLTELTSILDQQIRQELSLVVGVDKDVESLRNSFADIKAVIADAERKQVEDETQSIKLWLQRLGDIAYDMDDVLSEWANSLLKIEIEGLQSSTNPASKKVWSFINLPCFCISRVAVRRDIAIKIKKINGRLDAIAREKDRYNFSVTSNGRGPERPHTISYIDATKVRGRDGEKATLVGELLRKCKGNRTYDTISIVGMGGIGKTTLAQIAYHSEEVMNHFDVTVWVCVSEPFNDVRVAKAIVEQVQGNSPNSIELEYILGHLRSSVQEKKFLLVLDDVWTDDFLRWEPLRNSLNCGALGSKVLVTTQKKRVAQIMESSYVLDLELLSEEDCWSLFSQMALDERSLEDREELQVVGRDIARKCKRLPLTIKIIGGLMRFKDSVEDWKYVLESDMWELEAKKGIFPALLLSYFDLPSPVKSCFLYCANFPEDYEGEADNLIKLWMAQDYLSCDGKVDNMEAKGKEYFDTLVMRSFFQLRKDKGGDDVIRFKMHDMVLELANYLRKDESYVMEIDDGGSVMLPSNSSPIKPRHLTLIRSEDKPFPGSIGNAEALHTFWVQSFYDSPLIVSVDDTIPPDLFRNSVHLKALDMSQNRLRELPKEIAKLKNLRYLNLSHNPLQELPEAVCFLYRLQTLKLVACNHLSTLPQGIGKLRYLRHLEIERTDNLRALPKGIGKLSFLQTLSKFVLARSGEGEEGICSIGDLNGLNQLRGSIRIEGLGHVVTAAEAEKAELNKKKHITHLHMDFNPQMRAQGSTRTEVVAEALRLHPDLPSLHVSFYGGDHLPSWMTSITNLKNLRLQDCPNCSSLPPLGTLPFLENLCMENMHSLKLIGAESFGGVSNAVRENMHGTAADVIFPRLKKLKLSCLSSCEEWGTTEGLNVMPNLRYLKISECRKLKALPDILLQKSPIKKLYIHNSPLLHQQYEKKRGEHWMKISHISKVRIT